MHAPGMLERGQLTEAVINSFPLSFHNATASSHHLGPLCIHKGSMNFELD